MCSRTHLCSLCVVLFSLCFLKLNVVGQVVVTSPSRLHFTLIDLNGALGRVDGGVGVALNEPHMRVLVEVSERWDAEGDAFLVLERIKSCISLRNKYRVRVLRALPRHVGLGSMTQLSLCIARGVTLLEFLDGGRSYTIRELAEIVRRGGTSGIGVAAFERGGFILDCGHAFCSNTSEAKRKRAKTSFLPSAASNAPPPPVLFQKPLPEDWYFVVVVPNVRRGAHGGEEVEIFKKYCPIDGREVEKLCRIILMKLLPAVVEKDAEAFGEALKTIQGVGFKKIEVELQHDIIKELFSFFEERALGYGMSSFGPTTYALVCGEKRAQKLSGEVNDFLAEKGVSFFVTYSNVNNNGHVATFTESNKK